MPAPIPDEQAALLAAIVANPDDDTPRLVYADWLQENGDEEQAQFIRDSIRLARMKPRAKARNALLQQLRETRDTNGPRWLAQLGLAEHTAFYQRGLPVRITIKGSEEFFDRVEQLFALAPLRALVIEAFDQYRLFDDDLERLASMSVLARLTELCLVEQDRATRKGWGKLFQSPYLVGLKHLALPGCGISAAEAQELAAAPSLANLTDLNLCYNSIGVGGARAILESPHLTKLKNLWLYQNFFGQEDGEDEVLAALEQRIGDGFLPHASPADDTDDEV